MKEERMYPLKFIYSFEFNSNFNGWKIWFTTIDVRILHQWKQKKCKKLSTLLTVS